MFVDDRKSQGLNLLTHLSAYVWDSDEESPFVIGVADEVFSP